MKKIPITTITELTIRIIRGFISKRSNLLELAQLSKRAFRKDGLSVVIDGE